MIGSSRRCAGTPKRRRGDPSGRPATGVRGGTRNASALPLPPVASGEALRPPPPRSAEPFVADQAVKDARGPELFLVDRFVFRRDVVSERHEVVPCIEIVRHKIAEMRKDVISIDLLLDLVDCVEESPRLRRAEFLDL